MCEESAWPFPAGRNRMSPVSFPRMRRDPAMADDPDLEYVMIDCI
jgi:hypothetical protein